MADCGLSFYTSAKKLSCPICFVDIPDHALQIHVSLHPTCSGCRTKFISEFALAIHRASGAACWGDKRQSRDKRRQPISQTGKPRKIAPKPSSSSSRHSKAAGGDAELDVFAGIQIDSITSVIPSYPTPPSELRTDSIVSAVADEYDAVSQANVEIFADRADVTGDGGVTANVEEVADAGVAADIDAAAPSGTSKSSLDGSDEAAGLGCKEQRDEVMDELPDEQLEEALRDRDSLVDICLKSKVFLVEADAHKQKRRDEQKRRDIQTTRFIDLHKCVFGGDVKFNVNSQFVSKRGVLSRNRLLKSATELIRELSERESRLVREKNNEKVKKLRLQRRLLNLRNATGLGSLDPDSHERTQFDVAESAASGGTLEELLVDKDQDKVLTSQMDQRTEQTSSPITDRSTSHMRDSTRSQTTAQLSDRTSEMTAQMASQTTAGLSTQKTEMTDSRMDQMTDQPPSHTTARLSTQTMGQRKDQGDDKMNDKPWEKAAQGLDCGDWIINSSPLASIADDGLHDEHEESKDARNTLSAISDDGENEDARNTSSGVEGRELRENWDESTTRVVADSISPESLTTTTTDQPMAVTGTDVRHGVNVENVETEEEFIDVDDVGDDEDAYLEGLNDAEESDEG